MEMYKGVTVIYSSMLYFLYYEIFVWETKIISVRFSVLETHSLPLCAYTY